MTSALKFLKWVLWDFSGLRFLSEKILPPKEPDRHRSPSTFIFWVFGTYVAFFGIASQRYENKIDIIENRTSIIFSQLTTEAKPFALSRIPLVQNTKVPHKPEILKPLSIFKSLFGQGAF